MLKIFDLAACISERQLFVSDRRRFPTIEPESKILAPCSCHKGHGFGYIATYEELEYENFLQSLDMNIKKFDIIVLGARGSGKTVFLASMYYRLSGQEDMTRFFLYASPNQKKMLLAKYEEIADTTEAASAWPEATKRQDVPEYTFTCRVRTADQKVHDAFQFNYWDYAGELVTDVVGGEAGKLFSDTVEAKFKKADALLGILDGQKVLAFLNNEHLKIGSIIKDIDYILPEMENNENPVHFIITKWDMFEGRYSLKQVRDRLLQIPRFKYFLDQRKSADIPVRLIPISSVGTNFAEPKIENGIVTMVKKPGAIPHPINVEMPLACVIPDKLAVELQNIKREEERTRNASVTVAPKLSFFDWLGTLVGGTIDVIRRQLPESLQFADESLRRLTALTTSGARAREVTAAAESERLRRERDASLLRVNDQKTAVAHVIDNFVCLVEALEAKYPYSNINTL